MNFGVLLFLDQTLCLQGHIFSGQRIQFQVPQTCFHPPINLLPPEPLNLWIVITLCSHKVILSFPQKLIFVGTLLSICNDLYGKKNLKNSGYMYVCVLSYVRPLQPYGL